MVSEDKLGLDCKRANRLVAMFTHVRFKLLAFVPAPTGTAMALLGLFAAVGIVSCEGHNAVLQDAAVNSRGGGTTP